jgi:hypothetical protein
VAIPNKKDKSQDFITPLAEALVAPAIALRPVSSELRASHVAANLTATIEQYRVAAAAQGFSLPGTTPPGHPPPPAGRVVTLPISRTPPPTATRTAAMQQMQQMGPPQHPPTSGRPQPQPGSTGHHQKQQNRMAPQPAQSLPCFMAPQQATPQPFTPQQQTAPQTSSQPFSTYSPFPSPQTPGFSPYPAPQTPHSQSPPFMVPPSMPQPGYATPGQQPTPMQQPGLQAAAWNHRQMMLHHQQMQQSHAAQAGYGNTQPAIHLEHLEYQPPSPQPRQPSVMQQLQGQAPRAEMRPASATAAEGDTPETPTHQLPAPAPAPHAPVPDPAQVAADMQPPGGEHVPLNTDPAVFAGFVPLNPHTILYPVPGTLASEPDRPSSHLAKHVTAWVTKNKRKLDGKAREDFHGFVEKVREVLETLPPAELPELAVLAQEWGLPVEMATSMHTNSLTRVISAAVILAA